VVSELIVDVKRDEISIAVLEDRSLVELQKEQQSDSFAVGNIYLARIKKLLPGLNAAFVDVGYKKEAFLHYQDLGPTFKTQQKFLKQWRGDPKRRQPVQKVSQQTAAAERAICCSLEVFTHLPLYVHHLSRFQQGVKHDRNKDNGSSRRYVEPV